jgi:hypothetical protein
LAFVQYSEDIFEAEFAPNGWQQDSPRPMEKRKKRIRTALRMDSRKIREEQFDIFK